MTGLKQVENQRAWEKWYADLKKKPAYLLLNDVHLSGLLDSDPVLKERVRVFIDSGTFRSK